MKHKDEIFRLRDLGYSYSQIQKELNCSKGTISYHLGEGQLDKTLARSARSKRAMTQRVGEIKEESGCVDCKEKYPHYMLDFDHLPEYEKVGSIALLRITVSWEKIVEEMKKCEIVCANCHRIRTYRRIHNPC